jgi:hypothetical protein
MLVGGAWRLACAGALVGTLGASCSIDVELGLPDNRCYGEADTVVGDGETVTDPDGCNTCTCKDGDLVCTVLACSSCLDEDRPSCADMPVDDLGCYLEAECGPEGWQCVDACPCASLPMPPCAPPFEGCYYEGPFCNGEQWDCGAPICPTCVDQPVCDPPDDPLCYSEAFCNDDLGWTCQVMCPAECPDPAPECGGVSFASCMDGSWVCEGNAVCGFDVIECAPSPYPYCSSYSECGQQGWLCQESCDPIYCQDELPTCEPMGPPNCSPYPTCTSQGWLCAETCM